jgi:hypothetical protein
LAIVSQRLLVALCLGLLPIATVWHAARAADAERGAQGLPALRLLS